MAMKKQKSHKKSHSRLPWIVGASSVIFHDGEMHEAIEIMAEDNAGDEGIVCLVLAEDFVTNSERDDANFLAQAVNGYEAVIDALSNLAEWGCATDHPANLIAIEEAQVIINNARGKAYPWKL